MSIDPAAFEPEGEEHQDREHYKIGGPSEADWALRKLAQARQQMDDNEALYRAERNRLDGWLLDVNKGHERDATYFEAILRNWHDEQVIANPDNAEAWKKEKNKTISLPAGKLAVAKNPDSVVIDEEKFIPWALANKPEWVRPKYEPVKAEIKEAGGVVGDTGEIAPGVSVVPGELRWKAVTE